LVPATAGDPQRILPELRRVPDELWPAFRREPILSPPQTEAESEPRKVL